MSEPQAWELLAVLAIPLFLVTWVSIASLDMSAMEKRAERGIPEPSGVGPILGGFIVTLLIYVVFGGIAYVAR